MNPPIPLPGIAQLPVPTHEERTSALLVHVLSIFSGFIVPLIFFLVKKDSRFVAFHSLQVLIWHVAYMVIFILGMVAMFVILFGGFAMHPPGPHGDAPPPYFMGIFMLVWLFGMGGFVVNLILGILYAIKANNGEWALYPVFGKWALRKTFENHPQFS